VRIVFLGRGRHKALKVMAAGQDNTFVYLFKNLRMGTDLIRRLL
jgi:hypothetical protein